MLVVTFTNPASIIRFSRRSVELKFTPSAARPEAIRDQYSEIGWKGGRELSWDCGMWWISWSSKWPPGLRCLFYHIINFYSGRKGEEDTLKNSPHQLRPIPNRHNRMPSMNVIKVIPRPQPRRLHVINHELHVWWHPFRLYRAQINT
jgi:hypothetical protein